MLDKNDAANSKEKPISTLPLISLIKSDNDQNHPIFPFSSSYGWATFPLQPPSLGLLLVHFHFSDSPVARAFVIVLFVQKLPEDDVDDDDANIDIESETNSQRQQPLVFVKLATKYRNVDGLGKEKWERRPTPEGVFFSPLVRIALSRGGDPHRPARIYNK